jgi:hypothetical protein
MPIRPTLLPTVPVSDSRRWPRIRADPYAISARRRLRAQAKPSMARSAPPHAESARSSIPFHSCIDLSNLCPPTTTNGEAYSGSPTSLPQDADSTTDPQATDSTKVGKILPVALLHPLSFQTLLNISFSMELWRHIRSCC